MNSQALLNLQQAASRIRGDRRQPMHPLGLLLRMLGLSWWQQGGLVLLLAIKNAPDWAWPLAIAAAIAILEHPEAYPPHLPLVLAIGVIGMYLINLPLHVWYAVRIAHVLRAFEAGLRSALLAHLHALPVGWHDNRETGRLHNRVMRDVEQVKTLASHCYHGLLHSVLVALVAALVTAATQPLLLTCYLVLTPAAWGIAKVFERRMQQGYERFRSLAERAAGRVGDALRMLPYARIHGAEAFQQRRCDRIFGSMLRRGVYIDRLTSLFDATAWIGFQLTHCVLLIVACVMCWHGEISVAEVILYHGLFAAMSNSLYNLLYALPALQQGYASLAAITDLLGEESASTGGACQPDTRGSAVHISDLSFRYAGRDVPALDGVSLVIPPGSSLALVGRSGSGKSTLAAMLVGLREPDTGSIHIGGIDLRDLDRQRFRQDVAVVSQQVDLANDTLRANITYGLEYIDDRRIHDAIHAAQLDDVVAALPQGLDTLVGENGVQLSGGQRQRLAIARALARDPQLVILDEATSALDGETEQAIQTALDTLLPGRTSLIIAHRLSTIRHADRIAVMEAGRIVEYGHWDDLMERGGRFARMARHT